MSTKTESVVRVFMAAGSIDDLVRYKNGGPYKIYSREYGTDPKSCKPVTILRHGENGEVGPIHPKMLKRNAFIQDEGNFKGSWIAIPREDFTELRLALSHILGGEE